MAHKNLTGKDGQLTDKRMQNRQAAPNNAEDIVDMQADDEKL
jgi:hypothetical protein